MKSESAIKRKIIIKSKIYMKIKITITVSPLINALGVYLFFDLQGGRLLEGAFNGGRRVLNFSKIF